MVVPCFFSVRSTLPARAAFFGRGGAISMSVFSSPDFSEHEQVVFCRDAASGLNAIIAIHSTQAGPALGGCRIWPYRDEAAALADVLRLSRGMTLKAAMAKLAFGGGKSVIIGDPRTDKSEALFLALGRSVERLGGRYIVAEDSGTSVADMEIVRRGTRHVAGIAEGGSGDPSPATAWGVFHGMRAAVRRRLGVETLAGLTVAVQGLGHVGWSLCEHLVRAGARLVVADIDADRVRRAAAAFGAASVPPDAILETRADVFAPCALGAILNNDTARRLAAPVVAGSANNQLALPEDGAVLAQRGILYAPDYVINAGGIINIAHEGPRYDRKRAMTHVAQIHDTLMELFDYADAERLPPSAAADRLAEARLRAIPPRKAA
jgi:leucine dehydrogenase